MTTFARTDRRWLVAQCLAILFVLAVAAYFTLARPSAVSLVQRFTPATLVDQPSGAVVLAKEDGNNAVGLAVAPRGHALLVGATVLGQSGRGATGLKPRFTITDRGGNSAS